MLRFAARSTDALRVKVIKRGFPLFLMLTAGACVESRGLTTPGSFVCPESLQQEVVDLVNAIRAEHGLLRVSVDLRLAEAARDHSEDMVDHDFMGHAGSDGATVTERFERVSYDWLFSSENVAAGFSTADAVVNAWMNSPGHRANILSSRPTHLGVGVSEGPSTTFGTYWTLDFGSTDSAPRPSSNGCHP